MFGPSRKNQVKKDFVPNCDTLVEGDDNARYDEPASSAQFKIVYSQLTATIAIFWRKY